MIHGLELRINRYRPLRGSTFIELPSLSKNRKAVINVKNNDEFCFMYAILAKYVAMHPERISNYRSGQALKPEFESLYDWNCVEYPVDISHIIKFEKSNRISINVFGLDEKDNVYPLKVTDEELEDHRDLLLLTSSVRSHYCWIKSFNKLVHTQMTAHNRRILCVNVAYHIFRAKKG
jgi:hypothetical protein